MSLHLIKFTAILIFGVNAFANDPGASNKASEGKNFSVEAPKTYTSGIQHDYTKAPEATAPKGATALVWKKNLEWPRGQVEIYRKGKPEKFLRFITESHVFHTMVYFDEAYEWRVRYLTADDQPASEFSVPVEFTILRKGALNQYASRALAPVVEDVGADVVKDEKPVVLFESDGTPIALSKKSKKIKNPKNLPLTADQLPARLKQPDPFVVMQAPTRDPQSAGSKAGVSPVKEEPLFEEAPGDNGSADFDY